ncbi:hypothetical protein [Thiomicrorhabdus heinhorstiae]|uniref:Uncharacterized protein n=1 Tax=Thiomicrorhabdus heinhorstiae TaxID=2748010 RepID=A0ABS0BW05_9GAMM|nr:hypothetical protein [Thiomicrorhabdus heinhorstiae]MBF6057997.1 hypothetical protein [Thiomicrorhabdus heinhorstiae]
MKILLPAEIKRPVSIGADSVSMLQQEIAELLPSMEKEFIQDMSHISDAAVYEGDMQVDQVVYLKDNLYRCDYSYNWVIAWTCSGTQEAGRIQEKVRFSLSEDGEIEFKFLKLEL